MFKFFKKNKEQENLVWNKENQKVEEEMEKEEKDSKEIAILKRNQGNIVDKLDLKIEETAFATDNLIDITYDLAAHVEVQMESINRVVNEISNYSALAQEVFANTESSKQIASETLEVAETGNQAVNNSIGAMKEIEDSMLFVRRSVNNLNEKSAHINEMLKVINDISSNTNLLALNASIEAARAGEAGRGFAVVADEVKKLAENSGKSATQIGHTIEEINEEIANTIKAMDDSMLKIQEGTEISNDTMLVFKEIIQAVNNTNIVADEINKAVSKQTESLESVIDLTGDMSNNSMKVTSLVDIASLNTQYTKTSLKVLSEVSEDLRGISNKLLSHIDKKVEEETVLNTSLNSKPLEFDPHLANDQDSAFILFNIYASLLFIGSTGEISPGVAKSWYVEEDGLTWVFSLRKGVKFHNSREVKANDVKFSYERMLDPRFNSPNTWFLEHIEGAKEYTNGEAKEVKGVKILDDYRLSIKLISPYSGFLLNLGQFSTGILAKEDLEKGKFTGCGPYSIKEVKEDYAILKAFKDYYGGAPYEDKLVINYNNKNIVDNIIDGSYDFATVNNKEDIERVQERKNLNISLNDVLGTYYIGFNLEGNSIFAKSKEARYGLNMGINKEAIIDNILGGLGEKAKGPIPPKIVDNTYLEDIPYNVSKAKEILRREGLLNKGVSIKLIIRDEPTSNLFYILSEYIIKDLKELGLNLDVKKVTTREYLEPSTIKSCDLFVGRWIADTGDQDNYLEPLFNYNNSMNFTRYNNPKVMKLMGEAKEVINPNKKIGIYKEIQSLIVEDYPWVFLYHPKIALISKKEIAGVRMNPLGIINYENIMHI